MLSFLIRIQGGKSHKNITETARRKVKAYPLFQMWFQFERWFVIKLCRAPLIGTKPDVAWTNQSAGLRWWAYLWVEMKGGVPPLAAGPRPSRQSGMVVCVHSWTACLRSSVAQIPLEPRTEPCPSDAVMWRTRTPSWTPSSANSKGRVSWNSSQSSVVVLVLLNSSDFLRKCEFLFRWTTRSSSRSSLVLVPYLCKINTLLHRSYEWSIFSQSALFFYSVFASSL